MLIAKASYWETEPLDLVPRLNLGTRFGRLCLYFIMVQYLTLKRFQLLLNKLKFLEDSLPWVRINQLWNGTVTKGNKPKISQFQDSQLGDGDSSG